MVFSLFLPITNSCGTIYYLSSKDDRLFRIVARVCASVVCLFFRGTTRCGSLCCHDNASFSNPPKSPLEGSSSLINNPPHHHCFHPQSTENDRTNQSSVAERTTPTKQQFPPHRMSRAIMPQQHPCASFCTAVVYRID